MIEFKTGLLLAVSVLTCGNALADQNDGDTEAKPIWVAGGSLYVVIPVDRGRIFSFSSTTSKAASMKCIPPLPNDVRPVVGGDTAFIQTGRTVYAIGAHSDNWAKLTLPRDGMTAAFDDSCIRVSDNESFFVFGPSSNKWIGVDLEDGSNIPTQDGG